MRFGIADYGYNVWDGAMFNLEQRLSNLQSIGYEGTERLNAITEADVLAKAAMYHKMGMGFSTVAAPTPELSIVWSAAMGCSYVWTACQAKDLDGYCRQANIQQKAAAAYGLTVSVHNHMGAPVETQEQLETFFEKCPDCGVVLDTAHLAAMGGDPVAIVKKYPTRLSVIHLKDWLDQKPASECKWWGERGRFCELGAGNIGLDNLAVMKALVEVGYDGWIHVEHDTHLQEPTKDLAISREYLRKGGF